MLTLGGLGERWTVRGSQTAFPQPLSPALLHPPLTGAGKGGGRILWLGEHLEQGQEESENHQLLSARGPQPRHRMISLALQLTHRCRTLPVRMVLGEAHQRVKWTGSCLTESAPSGEYRSQTVKVTNKIILNFATSVQNVSPLLWYSLAQGPLCDGKFKIPFQQATS